MELHPDEESASSCSWGTEAEDGDTIVDQPHGRQSAKSRRKGSAGSSKGNSSDGKGHNHHLPPLSLTIPTPDFPSFDEWLSANAPKELHIITGAAPSAEKTDDGGKLVSLPATPQNKLGALSTIELPRPLSAVGPSGDGQASSVYLTTALFRLEKEYENQQQQARQKAVKELQEKQRQESYRQVQITLTRQKTSKSIRESNGAALLNENPAIAAQIAAHKEVPEESEPAVAEDPPSN